MRGHGDVVVTPSLREAAAAQYQPVTRINRHRLLKQSGHGDVFRHVLGGAGGWGDPAEGDPALIPHDVAEGKLSTEYVRREYGVAVDPA